MFQVLGCPLVSRGGRSECVRVGHPKDVDGEFAKEFVREADGWQQHRTNG